MNEQEVICWIEDEIIQTKRLLRQSEVGFIREDEEERIKALETILNLYNKEKEKNKAIDRQQKEIERLKQVEQAHQKENGKLRVELEKEKNKNKVIEILRKDMPKDTEIICMRKEDFERNLKSDYISIDKIREKIEKYEKDYERQDKEELFNMTKITAGKLSALQELLEEK